jgi:hypothetical protein
MLAQKHLSSMYSGEEVLKIEMVKSMGKVLYEGPLLLISSLSMVH